MDSILTFIHGLPTEVKLTLVLGIMNVIDYFTGTFAAIKAGVWDSHTSKWGAISKLAVLSVIGTAYLLDYGLALVPAEIPLPPIPTALGVVATICLMIAEAGSIFENTGKLGVKLPAPIRKALAQYTDEKFGDTTDKPTPKD